ncbi:MAG TPA: hypothetical protein VFM32_04620 [Spongiibacteraceae bacterium]|nr:hypothetical protein [Spongiibacteraceae bacterium]
MIRQTVFAVAVSSVLSLASQVALADDSNAGRAQSMQQATEQMREREQVYGWQMMSQQERLEYRERMRNLKTHEEREAFRMQHHEQMQQRAKERGVELPAMPMPQGQGKGMGQGQGQGMGSGMGNGQGKGR